jgi:hypothetical protein
MEYEGSQGVFAGHERHQVRCSRKCVGVFPGLLWLAYAVAAAAIVQAQTTEVVLHTFELNERTLRKQLYLDWRDLTIFLTASAISNTLCFPSLP